MNVYLDNAASTKLHPEVLSEMLPYLSSTFGNPSSIHAFGRKNKAAIEFARKKIAQLLGAKPNEIFFCSSGTEANNMVLKLAVENLGIERIITSKIEHKCVLNTCIYLRDHFNIELGYVNLDPLGKADLGNLEQVIQSSSKKTLVTLMHIQNELGTINNIEEIGVLCKDNAAFFHSDTVQSVAHYPFNLKEANLDFISASAHKFNGPLGVGFLYKKEKISLGTWLHGGGHEKNLRSSTENVAGIVGLAKAMEFAYQNLEEDKKYILSLKQKLKQGFLDLVEGVIINEKEDSTFTILSVSFPVEIATDTLMIQLDMAGIAVSGGSACASGALKESPVLSTLNFKENHLTLRFSFSKYNTKEELDYVLDFFKKRQL